MTATVEIAFGADPFDATTLAKGAAWTDVTSYVRECRYQTSTRSTRFDVFSAGNATIVLDARDREMDPSYASSTYVGDFRRSTPVRISGTHSSTDYVQWFGYVRLWTPSYPVRGDALTVLEADDALGLLARYPLDEISSAYSGDTAGARIARVLDDIGFPSGASWRDLDAGATLGATTWNVSALQHCQEAALTAGGFLYAQRDGIVTFDALNALTDTRQKTSQATYSSSMLHQPPPIRSGVGEGFRNLVRVGGDNVTTVEDDRTAANEAPVVFDRTDLLMLEQAWATSLADFYADLYATETPYTQQVTHTAATVSDAAYDSALFLRKLRDRVTVTFSPPGGGAALSDEVFIDGITGYCTPDRWNITHTYSSADAYDDNLAVAPANFGIWDTTTWDHSTQKWVY